MAGSDKLRIFGSAAAHPQARALSEQVHRVLFRYAREVVAAHALCPFLHNVEVGMGVVGVILEPAPSPEETLAIMREIGEPVLHLVFPLFTGDASKFERFGSKLANLVQKSFPEPLVHATFHPELVGGTENAYRLIGLLRQAPDPFVQFIPHGLQQGGTVLAGSADPSVSHAEARFQRFSEPGKTAQVLASIAELKRDRASSYQALIDEISAPPAARAPADR